MFACVIIMFAVITECCAMDKPNEKYQKYPYLNSKIAFEQALAVEGICEADAIRLETMMSFYDSDDDGIICGRNANRLKFIFNRAISYLGYKEFPGYCSMLQCVLNNIHESPQIQGIGFVCQVNCTCHCYPAKELEGVSDCLICLSPLEDVIALKSCSHAFCYECLFMWYANSIKKKDAHMQCPLCREPFGACTHKLFRKDMRFIAVQKAAKEKNADDLVRSDTTTAYLLAEEEDTGQADLMTQDHVIQSQSIQTTLRRRQTGIGSTLLPGSRRY